MTTCLRRLTTVFTFVTWAAALVAEPAKVIGLEG